MSISTKSVHVSVPVSFSSACQMWNKKKYTAKDELITSAALLKNKRYLEPKAKHEMTTTFCLRSEFLFCFFSTVKPFNLES